MHMPMLKRQWTVDDLHDLPDDGNTYEVVRGVLFVTPLPSVGHAEIAAVLGRRDRGDKRGLYVEFGIPDYWIVDGHDRSVRAVRGSASDVVVCDVLEWRPAGATEPLVIRLPELFEEARSSAP